MEVDKRYVFSGHAVGVAAHFHRLDETTGLDHSIPALGSSVIPVSGGRSTHKVINQTHTAEKPRQRTLLTVAHAESTALGKNVSETQFDSEVHAVVKDLTLLDQLHVDLVELHQSATRAWSDPHSVFSTAGCKIEGLRLGNVKVILDIDESPFSKCGTRKALNAFFADEQSTYRDENCERFHTPRGSNNISDHNGRYYASLVKKITLDGPKEETDKMHVDGYSIKWNGFGKIFLGEVIMTDAYRRVTMIRLKMGSSAGGTGHVGDAQSNGATAP